MSNREKAEEMLEMLKAGELLDTLRAGELFRKQEEKKKKANVVLWIFAIVGVLAAVATVAYALYLYFTPDYLEDFEEDFDDDFDDDFFEDDDDDEIVEVKPAKEEKAEADEE